MTYIFKSSDGLTLPTTCRTRQNASCFFNDRIVPRYRVRSDVGKNCAERPRMTALHILGVHSVLSSCCILYYSSLILEHQPTKCFVHCPSRLSIPKKVASGNGCHEVERQHSTKTRVSLRKVIQDTTKHRLERILSQTRVAGKKKSNSLEGEGGGNVYSIW